MLRHPKYKNAKIAFIADEIVCQTAGTESQLLALIDGLLRAGFEPHLILLRTTNFTRTLNVDYPIDYLEMDKIVSPHTFAAMYKLYKYLKRNEIRLIHTFFNDSSIIAPLVGKFAGSKIIVSRRDLGFWYSRKELSLLKLNKLLVDRIVANSEAVRKVVCEKEGYEVDRVSVIYNGHDLSRYSIESDHGLRTRLGIPADTPIVGMVANYHEYKRHDDVIEALHIMHKKQRNIHLVFIGGGDREALLKAKVKTYQLEGYVHFLGQLDNPLPIVKEFTIGVLTSLTEGFSNALIEYMGCGKPSVATNVGGNKEMIEDGRTGLLVETGNATELAQKILTFLEDQDLSEKVSVAAKETVYTRFNIDRQVEKYIALYQRELGTRP